MASLKEALGKIFKKKSGVLRDEETQAYKDEFAKKKRKQIGFLGAGSGKSKREAEYALENPF